MKIRPRPLSIVLSHVFFAVAAIGQDIPAEQISLGTVEPAVYGRTNFHPPVISPASVAGFSEPSTLCAWTGGRIFSEQPPDFRIGEYCTRLPADADTIDWEATRAALEATSGKTGRVTWVDSDDPLKRILFTGTGTVELPWIIRSGDGGVTTNSSFYAIEKSVSARPYRLYATRVDEGNPNAYVDLSGKYVKFFGEPSMLTREYATTGKGDYATSNIVSGIEYDARTGLLAARYRLDENGKPVGVQGQFVLAYYDTDRKDHQIASIVVEVTLPKVNTLSIGVGQELRPLGGGYEVANLMPAINRGAEAEIDDEFAPYLETMTYGQSTASGYKKGQSRVFAIAPTDVTTSGAVGMDMPWKADLYWKTTDPMGTLWTFENDWYLIRWPEDTPRVVISDDPFAPGCALDLSNYDAELMNYRYPSYLAVEFDDTTGNLVAYEEGDCLVRLSSDASEIPQYLPVRFCYRTSSEVCGDLQGQNPVSIPWPVGREVTLVSSPDVAGTAAASAARMSADYPGYIHEVASLGYNWNPRLYHFTSGDTSLTDFGEIPGVDPETGGLAETDPYATLESAIYGVNESALPIEVWWRGEYWGGEATGGELPYPIVYPGFVQHFRIQWPKDGNNRMYPVIDLYSQKGSADPKMLACSGHSLRFVSSNATMRVNASPFFQYGKTMSFGFRFRSAQDNALTFVTPGRLATVRSTGNATRALEISVADVSSNDVTLVARMSGRTVTSKSYIHDGWHEVRFELPQGLAGSELAFSLGRDTDKGEGAPLNVEIDRIACWSGESAGPDGTEDVAFLFRFEDSEIDRTLGSVAATLGGCSLACDGCVPSLGSPEAYLGVFTAENGVAPEIYYENDPLAPGYNPNEEHAFVTEEGEGQYVAWALRSDLNVDGISKPMVLVQYAKDGKGAMQPIWVDRWQPAAELAANGTAGGGVMKNAKSMRLMSMGDGLPGNDMLGEGGLAVVTNAITVGQQMIPPYPIGKLTLGTPRDSAITLALGGSDRNPVYIDRKHQMWARCAGSVLAYYTYPLQEGFWLPAENSDLKVGDLVGWQNCVGGGDLVSGQPAAWQWVCAWPATNGAPVMRIGQALAKATSGLPEMWNAASMAVAYPSPAFGETNKVVELIDPTQAQAVGLEITTGDFPSEYGFTLGSAGNCQLRQGRYTFKDCPPSVSDRFYIDLNAAVSNRMVLVGDYVEKESGGSYMRMNVLSAEEAHQLKALCKLDNGKTAKARWDAAIDNLAQQQPIRPVSYDARGEVMKVEQRWEIVMPQGNDEDNLTNLKTLITSAYPVNYGVSTWEKAFDETHASVNFASDIPTKISSVPVDSDLYRDYKSDFKAFRDGVTNRADNVQEARANFVWDESGEANGSVTLVSWTGTLTWQVKDRVPVNTYSAKDHLALVATGQSHDQKLGYDWVTVIENDDDDESRVSPGLPITMHVIRVVPELYADGIAVVTDPNNKLSEMLTLLYRTPLGSNAKDFEFDWRKMRPAAEGTLTPPGTNWIASAATEEQRRGRTSVLLGADSMSADDYVNCYYSLRYRPVPGTVVYATISNALAQAGTFSEEAMWSAWAPEQLAEGWLQRVLNSVTPFAQRVEDFYNHQSDAAYTMMEQIGGPYTGDVALNNDNLNDVGLLQLYQTVFNRCEMLLGAFGRDPDLSKQLLQAATRLNEFYTLLGAEAYSDAKNPLIQCADGESFPAGTFSFANQVPSLLDEELALLRGRAKSTPFPRMTEEPCFNRLVWNLTKGQTEGEAAYVNNYGIRAREGVLDVNCAAAQYPQGHGDAWGHYLSALKTYYRLIRNPHFEWTASMMEMLMDQKIVNVDYQDEEKFADAAVKLARTGVDAMDLTMRKQYKDQGTGDASDGAYDENEEQAFGWGEWETRTEMGAIYNWMVGNALLPTNDAPYEAFADKGITKLERDFSQPLHILCDVVGELERKVDGYEAGYNPLGLAAGTIPFDIDPVALDEERKYHFEQILDRAETALANCKKTLDYANVYGARLRQIQETETDDLAEREKTELSYKNQLIAIFGTPYPGDIGPGGTYEQGYDGPDLYNYNCMDLSQFSIFGANGQPPELSMSFKWVSTYKRDLYDIKEDTTVPVTYTVTPGGIRSKTPAMTGVRATEGSLQAKYRDFLTAYNALQSAYKVYDTLVGDVIDKAETQVDAQMAFKNLEMWIGLFTQLIVAAYDTQRADKEFTEWNYLYQDLNAIYKVQNLTGLTIVGTATGNEAVKQAKKELADAQREYENAMSVMESAPENEVVSAYENVKKKSQIMDNAKGVYADSLLMDAFSRQQPFLSQLDSGLGHTVNADDLNKLKYIKWGFQGASAALQLSDAEWTLVNGVRDALEAVATQINQMVAQITTAEAALSTAEAAYRAELYKGQMLLEEREQWRMSLSNRATANRYADMFNRMQRNIALTKYSTAFDTAQRYVWELAKVYDYETGLLSDDAKTGAKSGEKFLADIIATRSLGTEGVVTESQTTGADVGLYDVVAQMKANWAVLKGRIGINNPDKPEKWFSLRHELCRMSTFSNGWEQILREGTPAGSAADYTVRIVDDVNADPDFRRYCQPLAYANTSACKALVITFPTAIYGDENFFGRTLSPGDNQFSAADYATKIAATGVYFEGYDKKTGYESDSGANALFVREPNVYLVPIGTDVMRSPFGTDDRVELGWNVVDQVLPLPYAIGSTELANDNWVSTFSNLAGPGDASAPIRRHSTMRMGYTFTSSRLVGRSVWNTKWMLVIPATSINAKDQEKGLEDFAKNVTDIKIGFKAYSRSGN